jgi:hypothetical protein
LEPPPGHSWNCAVTFAIALQSPSQLHCSHLHSCIAVTVALPQSLLHFRSHLRSRLAVTTTFAESPSQLPPSHSWNCAVTTTFSESPSQSHRSHSSTPTVPITFSESPSELPRNYSYICTVNPVSTTVSYGVESVSWGLSLPTTYLPPSLSTQHLFNTNIYSTSLHTQADSQLFTA